MGYNARPVCRLYHLHIRALYACIVTAIRVQQEELGCAFLATKIYAAGPVKFLITFFGMEKQEKSVLKSSVQILTIDLLIPNTNSSPGTFDKAAVIFQLAVRSDSAAKQPVLRGDGHFTAHSKML